MRRARLTFRGAFHHCTNRGHGKERIFAEDSSKRTFLQILAESGKRLKIRILAYCLMETHYHLVLENSSGRMSDFFKALDGEFGTAYRRSRGGCGYVFQGRYNSTLIQDESYLLMAISYVLGNPVRARRAGDYLKYPWSSASLYFRKDPPGWVDCGFVEELYGSEREMSAHIRDWQGRGADLPLLRTELGPVLADESGIGKLKERFERRSGAEGCERKRQDDFGYEPLEKIYREFYKTCRVDLEKVGPGSRYEQGLRRKLLLRLKDHGGLKYREIARLPEFTALKMNSLSSLYRYENKRRR